MPSVQVIVLAIVTRSHGKKSPISPPHAACKNRYFLQQQHVSKSFTCKKLSSKTFEDFCRCCTFTGCMPFLSPSIKALNAACRVQEHNIMHNAVTSADSITHNGHRLHSNNCHHTLTALMIHCFAHPRSLAWSHTHSHHCGRNVSESLQEPVLPPCRSGRTVPVSPGNSAPRMHYQ